MANDFLRSSFICGFVGLIFGFGIIYVNSIECGTTDFTRKLILKGTQTERGEFPFLTALYLVEDRKFICGGSLISQKHVLTAAHCTRDRGFRLVPVDLIVLLGSYDLASRIERGGVQRDVAEIRVHPDWKVYSEKLDADIAILVLEKIVAFTNFIRPVCLPADDSVLPGSRGSIVGWGLTENGTQPHLTYPRHAFTNALNDSYCYTTDYVAAMISSLRTFCGGGEATSPNQGDSGGGYFVRHGSAWVQYGIISSLRTDATGHVDEHSIAIYTIVKEFKKWIKDTVILSGGEVGEPIGMKKIQIELNCDYRYEWDGPYVCFVYDVDIRVENTEVVFSGSHMDGKANDDVERLKFVNGTLNYLPDGLGNISKNLKRLIIGDAFTKGLNLKLIKRSSFKNLESLEVLSFWKYDFVSFEEDSLSDLPHLRDFSLYGDKLESIPANLLKYNLQLEDITFFNNPITTIDDQTFSNNHNLLRFNLKSNQLESIPANLFKNNLKLEHIFFTNNILKTIDEQTFSNNHNLKYIDLGDNRLKTIDNQTFSNNHNLSSIYLYSNQLESVPANLFKNNLKLVLIDLNSNQLESVPANLFKNNLNLKYIYLHSNRLKTISVDFSVLENLQRINLQYNLCIDKSYDRVYGNTDIDEFLQTVRVNCSSVKP